MNNRLHIISCDTGYIFLTNYITCNLISVLEARIAKINQQCQNEQCLSQNELGETVSSNKSTRINSYMSFILFVFLLFSKLRPQNYYFLLFFQLEEVKNDYNSRRFCLSQEYCQDICCRQNSREALISKIRRTGASKWSGKYEMRLIYMYW